LAETHTRDDAARLTFLVLYKCFQCLGYLPRDQKIPPEVIAHLRWYLHLDENVPCQVPPRSRRSSGTLIRQALKVTLDVQKALSIARHSMEQAALVMDHPPDLINAALETLIKDCYELPAFSTLDRLAGEVRTQVNERWCAQILARIPDKDRQRLDQGLSTTDGKSDYNRLKETRDLRHVVSPGCVVRAPEQGVRYSSPLPSKTEIVGTRFERKSWLPVLVLMGNIGSCQRPC
jgi:hypothetical protein